MTQKFKKKPVVIEAIELLYTTNSQQECIDFTNGIARKGLDGGIIIPTLEGNMIANTGDFIIKGVNGEFYPCKPDIFEKTYEKVKDNGKTGIELIANERREQIEVHGFLDNEPAFKSNEELRKCAIFCLTLNGKYYPDNWGDWFLDNVDAKQTRMSESEFKIEMLKIAGAFCAAEIDRLQALE